MQARVRRLARRVETGHVRRPRRVRPDAADRVVRGGTDRDAVVRQVEAVRAAGGGDARKPPGDAVAVEVREIEEHASDVRAFEVAHDGLRDLVAGGQLAARQDVGEEAVSLVVDDVRTLTADGLRQEQAGYAREVQGRGVELHELEVGQPRPRAPRRGDPVTGRAGHVRALAVDLRVASRGEHHGAGPDGAQAAATVDQGAPARPRVVRQEVHEERVAPDLDEVLAPGGGGEGVADLGPRPIPPGVEDPRRGVAALQPQLRIAPVDVELRPERHELADGVASGRHDALHERSRRRAPARPRACPSRGGPASPLRPRGRRPRRPARSRCCSPPDRPWRAGSHADRGGPPRGPPCSPATPVPTTRTSVR